MRPMAQGVMMSDARFGPPGVLAVSGMLRRKMFFAENRFQQERKSLKSVQNCSPHDARTQFDPQLPKTIACGCRMLFAHCCSFSHAVPHFRCTSIVRSRSAAAGCSHLWLQPWPCASEYRGVVVAPFSRASKKRSRRYA